MPGTPPPAGSPSSTLAWVPRIALKAVRYSTVMPSHEHAVEGAVRAFSVEPSELGSLRNASSRASWDGSGLGRARASRGHCASTTASSQYARRTALRGRSPGRAWPSSPAIWA